MSEAGENNFWHETRPHDEECQKARVAAKLANLQYPPCMPGCRVGQPWATLRLLPEQRERRRHGST